MGKTYFNDSKPPSASYRLVCASCRSVTLLTLHYYPHGPRGVNACPVCGARDRTNLNVQEVHNG